MLQTLPHARHLLPNPLGLSTGSHKEGEVTIRLMGVSVVNQSTSMSRQVIVHSGQRPCGVLLVVLPSRTAADGVSEHTCGCCSLDQIQREGAPWPHSSRSLSHVP